MNTLRALALVALSAIFLLFSNWLVFAFVHSGIVVYKSIGFDIVSSLVSCAMLIFMPICVSRFAFLALPKDIGMRLPENSKQAVLYSFIAVSVFLPIVAFFSSQDSFALYYSTAFSSLTIIPVLLSFLYYLGEEFFFRGFLLFRVYKYIGFHSIWITSLLFALFHIGKPVPEIIFAFFLGVTLSLLSFKTKSFLPAAVVHFVLSSILIIFIHVSI